MAEDKNLTGEPVIVETSDERLAAVEEAKRTGEELVSVGAKGVQPVDRALLIEETRRVSNQDASTTSAHPKYLEELIEGVDDVAELNIAKAKAHSEYSAEVVRRQNETNIEAEEKLRKDPYYYVNLIAEQNRKQVEEYNEKMKQYMAERGETLDAFSEEVRKISRDQAYSDDPITVLGKQAQDFKIDEASTKEALQEKDRIVYGAEDFKSGVKNEAPVPEVDESRKQEAPETQETKTSVQETPKQESSRKASKSKE